MKQEVTRRHKQEAWALDDVVYHTEAQVMQDAQHVRAPPAEGIFVHGMFLDGAAYNRHDQMLVSPLRRSAAAPLRRCAALAWVRLGGCARLLVAGCFC